MINVKKMSAMIQAVKRLTGFKEEMRTLVDFQRRLGTVELLL
jgi:hypothetical protein